MDVVVHQLSTPQYSLFSASIIAFCAGYKTIKIALIDRFSHHQQSVQILHKLPLQKVPHYQRYFSSALSQRFCPHQKAGQLPFVSTIARKYTYQSIYQTIFIIRENSALFKCDKSPVYRILFLIRNRVYQLSLVLFPTPLYNICNSPIKKQSEGQTS